MGSVLIPTPTVSLTVASRTVVLLVIGVAKVGRYIILHQSAFFVTSVRWQKTSVSANQRSPTLTTPKCKLSYKIS